MQKNRTQKSRKTAVALTAVVFAALMFSLGCEKTGKDADKPGKTAAGPTQSGKPASGICDEYATKLCEIVDPKSPACNSVKSTVALLPDVACQAGMGDLAYSKQKHGEKAKLCDELQEKLCNDIGPETKTCEMVRTQTKRFPPDRCESMMQKYPQILEDLKKREEANKPLTPEKQEMISKGDSPSFGPQDAKVTLVEFSDFECPYCSRAAKAVNEIKKSYAEDVRIIFRHFPLTFHKNAHLASQAALAAHEQGKFWEFHDKMFENQRALGRPDLEKYAQELKLDVAKFKKALDDEAYKKAVDEDMELGKEVAVRGTPTLFLNGERVQNPTDAEMISREIDKALGRPLSPDAVQAPKRAPTEAPVPVKAPVKAPAKAPEAEKP